MTNATTPCCQASPSLHSLDLAKFIGALLVIVIHTSPLAPYSPIADFYFRNVLARIAVPLFFSISGFLFSCKPTLRKTVLRLASLYLFWSAVYLIIQIPQWYASGWWGLHVILDYGVGLITKGTYFHLWYLLAALIATPLLFLLLRKNNQRLIWVVLIFSWAVECLIYSYAWIGIDQIAPLSALLTRFSGWFDGIFRALPLMLVGVLAGKVSSSHNARFWCNRMLIAFFALVCEASLLYFCALNTEHLSYLITTPVFTYFLLCFLLRCDFSFPRGQKALLFRQSSLLIYCIHPFIDHCLAQVGFMTGVITCLTVTIISVSLSLLYSFIKIRK